MFDDGSPENNRSGGSRSLLEGGKRADTLAKETGAGNESFPLAKERFVKDR